MSERFRVVTPENVAFEYEIAGFFSRLLAWLLDLLILILLTAVLSGSLSALAPVLGGFTSTLFTVTYFLLNWGYFILMEWRWGGQSLGKRALGLRVIGDDGVRITLLQSAIRNLFRVIDNLPLLYLVGGTAAFFSPQGKRLGDMAAGTLVIQERARRLPQGLLPQDALSSALLNDREALRRIDARLGLQERELLLKLAVRREQLPLARRLVLFEDLSEHLQERLSLTRPDHLSHEAFCLQIAAVILRGSAARRPAPRA